MKRIILSCLFIFSIYAIANAQDSIPAAADSIATLKAEVGKESSNPAIKAYNEGDFLGAIEIWEKEKKEQLEKGLEAAQLYYNLGDAYFRVNDFAHARLNYEKALLLDPGDRDTRHNIDYLSTKIEDKILVADTFFLSTWFRAVQNLFTSNTWAVISVVFFLLLMACLAVFFFTREVVVKKVTFYVGIVSMLVVIFANVFSFKQKNKIEERDTAVIMSGSAPIYSSPDSNSKELFILHSGTKVDITKEDRSWLEIEVDNGSVGWVQREKIEII